MSRPDQLRDKDSIQRDCISANIVGPVVWKLYKRDGEWVLCMYEPTSSANTLVPKFRFTFPFPLNGNGGLVEFAQGLQKVIDEWTIRLVKGPNKGEEY